MNRTFLRVLLMGSAACYSWAHGAEPGNPTAAATRGDPLRGAALYQAKCTACHSVGYNGVGPAHRGVFGRTAGQAAGFSAYSPALKKSGLIWSAQSLDRWLTDPEQLVPGQRMGISVPDATERADLIAYLQSLGPSR